MQPHQRGQSCRHFKEKLGWLFPRSASGINPGVRLPEQPRQKNGRPPQLYPQPWIESHRKIGEERQLFQASGRPRFRPSDARPSKRSSPSFLILMSQFHCLDIYRFVRRKHPLSNTVQKVSQAGAARMHSWVNLEHIFWILCYSRQLVFTQRSRLKISHNFRYGGFTAHSDFVLVLDTHLQRLSWFFVILPCDLGA